jgi:hypothetical protein
MDFLLPNTYLYFHYMCFILSDLKCYRSAKTHLWSAKEKELWKNNKEKKKLSNLQNVFFFLFFSLDLSYFQTS